MPLVNIQAPVLKMYVRGRMRQRKLYTLDGIRAGAAFWFTKTLTAAKQPGKPVPPRDGRRLRHGHEAKLLPGRPGKKGNTVSLFYMLRQNQKAPPN